MTRDGRTPLRLRGHHLGCVQGFAGHGYDAAFTARMADLAGAVRADPSRPVQVVAADDDACGPCPHRDGGLCARTPGAQRAVEAHDAAFLRALGLAAGDVTTVAAVNARLAADPAAREALRAACDGCPWTRLCTFFQSL